MFTAAKQQAIKSKCRTTKCGSTEKLPILTLVTHTHFKNFVDFETFFGGENSDCVIVVN